METRGSTWCGVRAPCMRLRFLHADSVFNVSGKETAQNGLAKGPKTSQVLDQLCLPPWQRLPAPSFCQRAHVFFSERPTLRVGHSAHGCNNRKANTTLTTVWLGGNKIGDRGAVALAGAIQALLATVFSCRPHSLFLLFGLKNLLRVTVYRSFDVLENRAFVT